MFIVLNALSYIHLVSFQACQLINWKNQIKIKINITYFLICHAINIYFINLSDVFLCNCLELTRGITIYLKDFRLTFHSDGVVLFAPCQHECKTKQNHPHRVKWFLLRYTSDLPDVDKHASSENRQKDFERALALKS